ncbi:MAG: flagellar export protein FliJ [Gammaproteobacteria bacterium]|nr:flagellar export protein FliJ [Gammaproteobacteria bacterium]
MATRVDRMQKLVEIAEIELDKAAQTFATLQAQYTHENEQLISLKQYAEEYAQSPVSASVSESVIQVQTRHAFGEKLQQAVQTQVIKVEQLAETVDKGREMWLEKRVRVKALEALLVNIKRDITRILDKREQGLLDELAARGVLKKSKDQSLF